MARALLSLLCIAHGIAHLVGFLAAWRLGTFPELHHKTTVLAGRLNLGEAGIRVMGVLWLLMAVAFAGVGVMVWSRSQSAYDAVLWAAAASMVISVIAWPDSQIGAAVDLVIALFVIAGLRFGWLTTA